MAFNIFGETTKDDIRVGYISTETGYVYDVTICEANEYAEKNPGTQFIFKTRDIVQYLTINEVNQLSPSLLEPQDSGSSCDGIVFDTPCKPPSIEFYGGGGVGVQANPIIGDDGSVIAIDLVHGGFGYQYPPIVEIVDNCKRGSGAVVRAVLGEVVESVEVFDEETDFEEYEICEPDEGYGRSYGPNGEDLGNWDPGYYTKIGTDPIQREIDEYEKIVRDLSRKPFWSTRKERPSRITSNDPKRISPTITYDVIFPRWNDFMNTYAVSPAPPSNVRGTDYASVAFTMEWQEDFPVSGEYIFRGLCDNTAELYVDDQKLGDLNGFNQPVSDIKKRFESGIHNIRVNLFNSPVTTSVTQNAGTVDIQFNVFNQGRNSNGMKVSFVSVDGKDSFTIKANEKTNTSRVETIRVRPDVKYKVVVSSNLGQTEQGLFKNEKKDKEVGEGEGNKMFGDRIGSENDNDDIQLISNYGLFKSNNRRKIEGRSTYDISFSVSSSQLTQIKPVVKEILEPKSWNENPMGVALTIDAPPEPPPPQELPPEQEGRCPPSPIWTTRFPSKGTSWYPVNFDAPRTILQTLETKVSSDVQEVEFTIYGQGAIKDIFFTFVSSDGKDSFTIDNVNKNKTTRVEKIKIRKNVKYNVRAHEDSTKHKRVEQGIFVDGKKSKDFDKEVGVNESSDRIFADYVTTANDNDDMQIRCSLGKFTSSNKRKVTADGRTRSTYDLTYVLDPGPFSGGSDYTTKEIKLPGWSRFMNRYAISPVKPLDLPGSDQSGVTVSTNWDIDIPYDGFYGVRGTRDNLGRILIDNVEVSRLDNFQEESPKLTKVFIPKGKHIITAEVYNEPIFTPKSTPQKIFSTKDWQVSVNDRVNITLSVYNQGRNSDKMKATFISEDGKDSFTIKANERTGATRTETIRVRPDISYRVITTSSLGETEQGLFKGTFGHLDTRKKDREQSEGTSNQMFGDRLGSENDNDDLQILANVGEFKSSNRREVGGRSTFNLSFKVSNSLVSSNVIKSGTVKSGISYFGPDMFYHVNSKWGGFMNDNSVSPYLPPLDKSNNKIIGTKTFTWTGVNFPQTGEYKIKFQGDNVSVLKIGGKKIAESVQFKENNPSFDYFYIEQGVKDIVVELTNQKTNDSKQEIFNFNPTGFSLYIERDIAFETSDQTSWAQNPVGISAVLIPPPCPKLVGGRGVVVDVTIDEPGNGYPKPPVGVSTVGITTYPVVLTLKEVNIINSGINYNCGEDPIKVTPDNGTVLTYECDSFGRITAVGVVTSGIFTTIPEITIESGTGVNVRFSPQFQITRDPIIPPESVLREKLIQVTDLVGLKQNGYIDGRAYYGSVFYKDGVRYAGVYETVGEVIRVYETLQESITAKITSVPNAIERSGTDTELSSNNRRLNIPRTPENLI